MEKFINVNDLLISLNGIVGIEQTAATTTAITYGDGLIATLTHASETAPAASDDIISVIEKALSKSWTTPVYAVETADSIPAISGVAYTHVAVPTV